MTTASTDDDPLKLELNRELTKRRDAEAQARAEEQRRQEAEIEKQLVSMTDEERERRALFFLDKLLGPGDEHVFTSLADIWKGTAAIEVADRDGRPAARRPNYNERMSAMDMLMNRHRGRAVFRPTGPIKPKADDDSKWDPDNLSMEDLRQMKELAGKVKK